MSDRLKPGPVLDGCASDRGTGTLAGHFESLVPLTCSGLVTVQREIRFSGDQFDLEDGSVLFQQQQGWGLLRFGTGPPRVDDIEVTPRPVRHLVDTTAEGSTMLVGKAACTGACALLDVWWLRCDARCAQVRHLSIRRRSDINRHRLSVAERSAIEAALATLEREERWDRCMRSSAGCLGRDPGLAPREFGRERDGEELVLETGTSLRLPPEPLSAVRLVLRRGAQPSCETLLWEQTTMPQYAYALRQHYPLGNGYVVLLAEKSWGWQGALLLLTADGLPRAAPLRFGTPHSEAYLRCHANRCLVGYQQGREFQGWVIEPH